MSMLDAINDAMNRMEQAITTEAAELATILAQVGGPSQAELDAVVLRLDGMSARIRGMVEPPMPEPPPSA